MKALTCRGIWVLLSCQVLLTLGLASARGQQKGEKLTPEEWRTLAQQSNEMRLKAAELAGQVKHADAAELNAKLLKIYERLFPADQFPNGHLAWAAGLGFHAAMLFAQQQELEAIPFAERSVAMFDKLFPPREHPDGHAHRDQVLDLLGMLLYNRGAAALAQHDLREALLRFDRAVQVYERLYPVERHPRGHADLARAYNGLGGAHLLAGEHHLAATCLKKSLVIQEKLNPKPSEGLARSLNNLGSLLRDQGEYTEARGYLERATSMFRQIYPDGHVDRALALNNLGILYHFLQEEERAVESLDAALEMFKNGYPNGHADLVGCLACRSAVSEKQGDHKRANAYADEALGMAHRLFPEKTHPKGHLMLFGTVHNMATFFAEAGEPDKSEKLFREAITIAERIYPVAEYPAGHPHLAMNHEGLGTVLMRQKRVEPARIELELALKMYQDWANAVGAGVSEAEALNVAAKLQRGRDMLLSATRPAKHVDDSADAVYAHVWRNKAAITQLVETRQQVVSRTTDPELRRLWNELIDARLMLSHLAVAPTPADAKQAEANAKKLRDLTLAKENLEGRLARNPEVARTQERARRLHSDLVRELPAGTVFVDLLRYMATEPGLAPKREQHYAAFVIRTGMKVVRVELGPAEQIDRAVRGFRETLQQSVKTTSGAELRNRVWEPIAAHFGGDRVILIAPDGALTGIPWGALPGSKKEAILLEENPVIIVPHGPFLLRQLTEKTPANNESGRVVVTGGVSYDDEAVGASNAVDSGDRRRSAPTGLRTRWSALGGTRLELEAIKELAGKRKVLALTAADASAARLIVELRDAQWAHLATHGFFADPEVRSAIHADSSAERFGLGGERTGVTGRNPLLLSGLVWAGANRPPSRDRFGTIEGDRGILTAEAIAALPLGKMRMVVLSACETGLGETAGGEGVLGLQRAFHQAGAQRVVASLWKVDDQATVALMLLFYRDYWKEGRPPLASLRNAQLELYRHPKKIRELTADRGGLERVDISKMSTAHPRLWAAFVMSGTDREELVQLVKEVGQGPK